MQMSRNISVFSWLVIVIVAVLAVLPVGTEMLSGAFYLSLVTRIMILAIAAVSLNLILGFGGMISFGHAAFLGLGGYCVAIPAFYGVYNGIYQIALAVVVSAVFALVTGAISLRTKGVYFIMITMAFAQMVFFAFVSIEEYGGDDGLVVEARSRLGDLAVIDNDVTLYYVCFTFLLGSIYLVYRIVNSRFGMVIRGARANEARMQAIGYNTYLYKLVCYVISGTMCGLAGALLANYGSFAAPETMEWTTSGELMFMIILGGTGTIFGPLVGTVVFIALEEILSRFTIYWQLPFGILLILVVLFARGGIAGLLSPKDN
jgi:branched-chain amino acid transport system permease protein